MKKPGTQRALPLAVRGVITPNILRSCNMNRALSFALVQVAATLLAGCVTHGLIGGQTAPTGAVFGSQASARSHDGGHIVILHTFTGGDDGGGLTSTLILDSQHNLYGTTAGGGKGGVGVVFELSAVGAEKVLYSFHGADGSHPHAGVLRDDAGKLFGTTVDGGAFGGGVAYEVSPQGVERVLHSFGHGTDGINPYGALVRDAAGNLYGTTAAGGTFGGGIVFELRRNGREIILHSFGAVSDGASPFGGLLLDSSGNLFGVTMNGGSGGSGVLFKIAASGAYQTLTNFHNAVGGGFPAAGIIRGPAGNFFGTLAYGGKRGGGVVFEVDSNGNETVLHNFGTGSGGYEPDGDLTGDPLGNLYGTTAVNGEIFKVTAAKKTVVLATIGTSQSGLVRDSAGHLYGTAGAGIVFEFIP